MSTMGCGIYLSRVTFVMILGEVSSYTADDGVAPGVACVARVPG